MTIAELAEQMDESVKTMHGVIEGQKAITPDMAWRLEHVLGVPADF